MDADADADADADGGGVRRSEVLDDVATRALAGTSAPRDQTAALRALGMIAEPSPFRQSREERLAESRRNAARARAAKASGGGGGGGGGPAPPVKPRAWDPALAALGRYADDDAFPSAAGGSERVVDGAADDEGVHVHVHVRAGEPAPCDDRTRRERSRPPRLRRRRARQGRSVAADVGVHRGA